MTAHKEKGPDVTAVTSGPFSRKDSKTGEIRPQSIVTYLASDCSFSTLGIEGIMTVDPADMNFGDKRAAAAVLGRSRSRKMRSARPYAQQNHPTIM